MFPCLMHTSADDSADGSLPCRRSYAALREKQALTGGLACYGVYKCADGESNYCAGHTGEKFWKIFFGDDGGAPRMVRQAIRYREERKKLRAEIAALFITQKRDQWIAAAAGCDTCLTPRFWKSERSKKILTCRRAA